MRWSFVTGSARVPVYGNVEEELTSEPVGEELAHLDVHQHEREQGT